MNMRKYVARQIEVEADEIKDIAVSSYDRAVRLLLSGGSTVDMPMPSGTHHKPQVGDYVIHLAEHNDTYVCPRAVFVEKYRLVKRGGMTFGMAVEALKLGLRVAREGWNGKGMWIALSPGAKDLAADKFWAGPNREFAEANGGTATVRPYITMKSVDGEIVAWTVTQTDALADDWMVVV